MTEMKLIKVTDVKIGERVRKLLEDPRRKLSRETEELVASFEHNGQIQPIVVDGSQLIAGFRRWNAAIILALRGHGIGWRLPDGNERKLPIGHLLAIDYSNLTPIERLKIEVEENVRRKDFTPVEEALGFAKIKKLMEEIRGAPVTNKEVAKTAGVSVGQVHMGLQVAYAVQQQGKTHLLQSSSIMNAYNKNNAEEKMKEIRTRTDMAAAHNRMEERAKTLHERLFNGDGLEWARNLPDASIDFVSFDPPWGIDIDSYDRWSLYGEVADNPAKKAFQGFIKPMIPELFRILKDDTYMVVWFAIQHYAEVSRLLLGSGFNVRLTPSVWYKTDKKGSQNDSSRVELCVYETFFVCEKGKPRLFKTSQKNVYPYPLPEGRGHLTQKSVDLQVDILERYTYGSMLCIDPSFGSGSFLRACQRLGRPFKGAEINKEHYDKAIDWLKYGQV
jgi:DNA modification methylase